MSARWPDIDNANAASELAALPNVNVCPECEGDGTTPYSLSHDRGGWCSLCHGSGIVSNDRLNLWRRNYESQVLYHSGHKP